MKKVEALINPAKLEDVKAALLMIGITGLTTTELRVPAAHGWTVRRSTVAPDHTGPHR